MPENKRSVDVVYFDNPADAKAHGAGGMYTDAKYNEDVVEHLYVFVPADNERGYMNAGAIHVRVPGTPHPDGFPSWEMTGDPTKPETLTLTPSLHLQGFWHGYLTAGRLESC
jgi:hypothetical protein